jgi:hypothetical protein
MNNGIEIREINAFSSIKIINKYLEDLFIKRDNLRQKLERMGVDYITNTSFINLQLELYVTVRQIHILDSLIQRMKVEK